MAKLLVSKKGLRATSQMAIIPAPVLNFKLSSGSRQNAQLQRSAVLMTRSLDSGS